MQLNRSILYCKRYNFKDIAGSADSEKNNNDLKFTGSFKKNKRPRTIPEIKESIWEGVQVENKG